MRLPRIPQDRVIDAVPVALALILISVAWVLPVAGALSMLHIWLWLRHPRSKSRYLIFAAVMSLYLGVFVVCPVLLAYAETLTYGHSIMHTPRVPMFLMIAAATGILPILYRLVSRCSLTFHGETPSTADNTDSRAGISDLLLLSLLCSIVFITARVPQESVRWYWAPTLDLLVSLVISAFALLGMRLGAHGSRSFGFAAFMAVWIGGYATIKLMFWGVNYVRDKLLDNPEWLADEYYWGASNQAFFVAMFFVALFPSLCSRCGVVLTNRSWADAKSPEAESPRATAVKNKTDSRVGVWLWLGDLCGRLMVLACLLMITVYPFASVEEYASEDGYRIAGWPVQYWLQFQTEDSSDPWYWTSSHLWNTVHFHLMPLVFDVLLTFVFWVLILPPKRWKQKLGPRWLRVARWTCVIGVLLQLTVTNYVAPFYRNRSFSQCVGLGIRNRESAPTVGLFPSMTQMVEDRLLPKQFRMERGLPTGVTFEKCPADALSQGLAIPTLRSVILRDCTLETQHIELLTSLQHLWHLELVDCQYPPNAMDDFLTAPSLVKLEISEANGDGIVVTDRNYRGYLGGSAKSYPPNYLMDWRCVGGDLALPEHVTDLVLIVPNAGAPQYVLNNAPDLKRLELRNTTGEVPDSVVQLKIENAPSLAALFLDNCQRVDLAIRSTAPVEAIHGLVTSADSPHARLTSLDIQGSSSLTSVSADISDCTRWNVGQYGKNAFLNHLTLTGQSGGQFQSRTRMDASRITAILGQMQDDLEVINLEFQSMPFDQNVANGLPHISYGFTLIDCDVAEEAFTEMGDSMRDIVWFNAPCYAPDLSQLMHLFDHCESLWKIHVNGRNLVSLPNQWGRQVESIRIDHLNADPKMLIDYDWGNVFELELVDSRLTDEVLKTWKTMPNVTLVDLTGSKTSIQAVATIVNQCPNVDVIDLSTAKDPQFKPYQYGKTLRLNGRKIRTQDLDIIRPLQFDYVDLRGCEVTPDARDAIQAELSDTGYDLDNP